MFIEHIRLNITTVTTSDARDFIEFLRSLSVLPNSTASWRMRVIYTSKGFMKMGCALSIEKYGSFKLKQIVNSYPRPHYVQFVSFVSTYEKELL
jgi:hypothetical protein